MRNSKPWLALLLSLSFIVVTGENEAWADRIQLPADPDISLGIGSGAFLGNTSRYDFTRKQPLYLHLELTAFNRGRACRWLCRMNIYGSLNLEDNSLGYRNNLPEIALKDDSGNMIVARKSGVTAANINSGSMWSGGGGLRLSILDVSHFHIDGFAEANASLRTQDAEIRNLDVHALLTKGAGDELRYGSELDLDVTALAQTFGTVTFRWRMLHTGLTFAFPLQPKRLNYQLLTPFLTVGYIWFDSNVGLSVDKKLLDDLARYGVDKESIPSGKQVSKESVTVTIGGRLETGRNNAFELNGTYIPPVKSFTAYMITASYSLRFDWW